MKQLIRTIAALMRSFLTVFDRNCVLNRSIRLAFERLEDRWVPANYYWDDPVGGGLWSVAGNWRDDNNQVMLNPPGASDTLIFRTSQQPNKPGKNTDSVANIDKIAELIIDETFTMTIAIQGQSLRIIDLLSMAGGTLQGQGGDKAVILTENSTTGSWTGGAMRDINFQVGPSGGSVHPSLTIAGQTTKHLISSLFENNGSVTWSDSIAGQGDIIMAESEVINTNGGTFLLQSGGRFVDADLPFPVIPSQFTNRSGLLWKNTSTDTAFQVDFLNRSEFRVTDGLGSVSFYRQADQAGVNAVTTLQAGGCLQVFNATGQYDVRGGVLQGNGFIQGGLLARLGAIIRPGFPASFGTLTVSGDYTQEATGTLEFEIFDNNPANGNFDRLLVNGAAALDGTIRATLQGGANPNGVTYRLMEFASRNGTTFNPKSIPPRSQLNYHNTNVELEFLPPPMMTFQQRHGDGPLADFLSPPDEGYEIVAVDDDTDLGLSFPECTLTFTAGGSFVFTPVEDTKGDHLVKVTWRDASDNEVQQWIAFEVVNDTPSGLDGYYQLNLSSIPSVLVIDNVDGVFTWIWDVDSDLYYVRTVNGQTANVGAAIDMGGGVTMTIAADGEITLDHGGVAGVYTLEVTVFDLASESETYTITVELIDDL